MDSKLGNGRYYPCLVNNMVTGVSEGFEKKLQLVGVGYRVQLKGNSSILSSGFLASGCVQLPKGVTAETPSQTEVVV